MPDQTKFRLLFVGDDPAGSSPHKTMADALTRCGHCCRFVDPIEHGLRDWLRLARRSDAVVLTSYRGLKLPVVRRLALAVASGVVIIRWWVGTDVMNCLREAKLRHAAAAFDPLVTTNVAVASHLVEELDSIGIKSRYIPSVLSQAPSQIQATMAVLPKSVLVYLPSRLDFYGYPIVRQAVQANPELRFVIVGDRTHSLAEFANVESLGWVKDMANVWEQVGLLLRITEHDGMPRMVLDALLRGKYVLYSWPFPGCWLAKNPEEVQDGLSRFLQVDEANEDGIQAVLDTLDPDPAVRFAEEIQRGMARQTWHHRFRAIYCCLTHRRRLRRSLRNPS